jgi:DNA-binding NtrC family response regulator
MNGSATSIPSQETISPPSFLRIPRLIVVEKRGEILALLKRKLSSEIDLDAVPSIDTIPDRLNGQTYDMAIWVADGRRPQSTKLQDLFALCARSSPQTHAIVIAEQEPDPLPYRFNQANYQYIPKPIDGSKLCDLVGAALKKRPLKQSLLAYPEVRVLAEFEGMIGISLPMREVFERIVEASSADIPVLITGETGTGKELVAAAIHNRSKRKNKPYIPVNTGAIAPDLIASELFGHEKGAYTGAVERREGFFEQADGGTIFLDEISTMDEKAQVGLLRILETRSFRRVRGDRDIHVDVRVLAATNDRLDESIKQKRFREDLYYRLDVFQIHLPPLRERPGGVTLLTNHFVIVFNSLYQKNVKVVSPEAYRCLRRYSWPGNVRELKNVIQRAVLMARDEELTVDLIPERIREATDSAPQVAASRLSLSPGMTLKAVEKEVIAMTLAVTRGNRKEAARKLGISRRALYNKIAQYGLE